MLKKTKKEFVLRNMVHFLLLVTPCTFMTFCASNKTPMKHVEQPAVTSPQKPSSYIIQFGDQLDVKFFYNPELNENLLVRPDGKISLQLIDDVQAAGLTPLQLDALLTQTYSRELRKPEITVIVRSFTAERIYVGGEVNTQGLMPLPVGMTALQAIIQAGGFMETAKPEETIVIRKGLDNRPVPLRVDLSNVLYGQGGGFDFPLQPHDIVYVPKSAIAKANKFVNQYIERLLLFRGISLGFTYELRDFFD